MSYKRRTSRARNVSTSVMDPTAEERNSNATSLASSRVFCGKVQSVYERMQEREALEEAERETQETKTTFSLSTTLHAGDERGAHGGGMAHRLSNPLVPLVILERMQLVFEVYGQSQRRKRPAPSCFDDPKEREEEDMNELNLLICRKEQELEMGGRRFVLEDEEAFQRSSMTEAGTATTPGIPFCVFERFIAEPYFDFLFPLENTAWQRALFMDSLQEKGSPFATPADSFLVTKSKFRPQTRAPRKEHRASHLEAIENIFCVMDTNGDGFLSWDEFSSYILRSGQQNLLADEYRRGDGAEKKDAAATKDEKETKKKGTGGVGSARYVMNFAPTPVNVSVWQQQYPLVRYLFHSEPISRLILARRGRRYITTGMDGLVKLWRPDPRLVDAHGKPSIVHERNLFAAGAPIIDMVLAPDSVGDAEVLAVVAMDGTVTLLRVGTGEVLKTFVGRWAVRALDVETSRYTFSSPTKKRPGETETVPEAPLFKSELHRYLLSGTTVLRPSFKIRAYHREAIEIFFTDVSRYFTGLGVVAPTYEHLEWRRPVKLDVLFRFGETPNAPVSRHKRSCIADSSLGTVDAPAHDDRHVGEKCNDEDDSHDDGDHDGTYEEGEDDSQEEEEEEEDEEDNCDDYDDVVFHNKSSNRDGLQGSKRHRQQHCEKSKLSSMSFGRRLCAYDGDKCWFARSVAFARYDRTNSTSFLPSGVFLFLGFETGLLQIYTMRTEWFTVSNLSMTRIEPPALHEPLLSLPLHRDAITIILTSESHDLLMTASNDGTVIVRHISRVQVPFLTLGDGVLSPGAMMPLYPSGHVKRITCMCWNSSRGLLVTGGADRFIIFWTPFSSRPLYRVNLSTFHPNSGSAGIPLDVSFLHPPRQPLMLLVLDSRRVLYFIDIVSYQCLNILHDDSLPSLRAGDMLRARYDAVDDRLILGGRHVRVWDMNQSDEYPQDYCGHRRAIVGVVYQRDWGFWVSADDSLIIIWNAVVLDRRTKSSDSTRQENVSKRSSSAQKGSNKAKSVCSGPCWALGSAIVRSWSVEGGICALALEEAESAHIFVALVQKRCILEYNIFSGSMLRVFNFPKNMGEISSLACGASSKNESFMRPITFLCGTFEREHSSNGTTALYALSSGGDMVSSTELADSVHRCITTTGVGVSCAIIVASLGFVAVGHRGGISITPVNESTTCPIACTRLTDYMARRKSEAGEMKRPSHSVTSLRCRSLIPPVTGSIMIGAASNAFHGSPHPLNIPETQEQLDGRVCPFLPLDLVALFPGPLLQDPVTITREFLQQRERYLFNEEAPAATHDGELFSNPLRANNREKKDEEGTDRHSKGQHSKSLLLFSDEFIASASAFSGSFGVFLREQLSTLGYVGLIVPVGKTGFVASGSDDGLVQFWDLCSMSEVMRFRVTYTLDAVTSMEVSEDTSHLAVGDANGYILLLDISSILWQPAVSIDKRIGMEDGVRVLRRWRGHRQSITSVRFVEYNYGTGRREVAQSLIIHRSLHAAVPPTDTDGCGRDVMSSAANVDADKVSDYSMKRSSRRDSVHCHDNNDDVKAIFLCTSGEDSYIYTWRWEAGPFLGGSVCCLGCFGGGTEVPPAPPLDKLTNCAWRVLEVVRKTYITERLFAPGGVLSGENVEAAIPDAVDAIREDMRAVKRGTASLRHAEESNTSIFADKKTVVDVQFSCFRDRAHSAHLGSQQRYGDGCPATYVLAFEDGLYYDRDLSELLERLIKELKMTEKKQRVHVPGGRRRRRSTLLTGPVCATERNASKVESRPSVTPPAVVEVTSDHFSATAARHGTIQGPFQHSIASSAALSLSEVSFLTPPPQLRATMAGAAAEVVVGSQGDPLKEEGACASASGTTERGAAPCILSSSLSGVLSAPQPTTAALSNSAHGIQTSLSVEPLTVTREGTREPYTMGEEDEDEDDWDRLPPVTVPFATPSPLPRMRRGNANGALNTTQPAALTNGLPLLSEIIRRPEGKAVNGPYGDGVKVLMKERPRSRSCRSAFLDNVKMPQWSPKTHKSNPEELSAKRRERKRFNAMWGAARIMGTLMKWKAPRVSSASLCRSRNGPNDKRDVAVVSESSKELPPLNTPIFIPCSLGPPTGTPKALQSLSLSEGKNLALTLRNEMEAMKMLLQAKMHEKQLLVVQERLAGGDATSGERQEFLSE